MIVEDDYDQLILMRATFRASGYVTAIAQDAISAISVARQEKPDLVVLDIKLPGGDGFQVIERMQSMLDLMTIPIIVVSASSAESNRGRALKAGALAFFEKPLARAHLMATVNRIVNAEEANAFV